MSGARTCACMSATARPATTATVNASAATNGTVREMTTLHSPTTPDVQALVVHLRSAKRSETHPCQTCARLMREAADLLEQQAAEIAALGDDGEEYYLLRDAVRRADNAKEATDHDR